MIDEKKLIEEIKSLTVFVTGLRAGKGVLSDFAKHYKESVLRIIEEQPKTDWIPCEERLPSEENKLYLTYKSSENIMVLIWTKKGFNTFKNEDGSYHTNSEIKNIIAWQPIQPYKKEGAE